MNGAHSFAAPVALAALAALAAAQLTACHAPAGQGLAGGDLSPPAAQVVEQSPNDPRDYAHVLLGNGLRVMLISEPGAKRAGAALAVGVGSGANPPERPGLAHFLEHMLFLGTEKYPEPNAYQQFIVEQGGRYNAYTAFDHTNYFFEVKESALAPALDRFAQFFIAPLFQVEYVDRERNAVHAEYELGRTNDLRRKVDVLREALSDGHPLGRFSVGNLDTLGGDQRALRAELVDFYQRQYSANRMTLALFGPQPIAELRALAESQFAEVPNRGLAPWREDAPLFAPGTLPLRLGYVPEKELRELSLSFPTPSVYERYDSRPLDYLAALLGDEGADSLLTTLKRRGQATGLSAGRGISYLGASMFDISIDLTERGLDETEQVIAAVFAAINTVRQTGPERWRFEERRQLGRMGFEFSERGEPMGFVLGLAANMLQYPVHRALKGPAVAERYAPALIEDMLARLVPENCLVMVADKRLSTTRASARYQTPFQRRAIDDETLARWRAGDADTTALPGPNSFIPERAARRLAGEPPSPLPTVSRVDRRMRYWHRPAHDYAIPKAHMFLALRFPGDDANARDVALSRLYASAVNEKLSELAWPARVAGMSYGLNGHRNLTLSMNGFDERQPVFWSMLWDALLDPALPEARFADTQQRMLRDWRNLTEQRPFRYLIWRLEQLMRAEGLSEERLIDAASALSQQDVLRFAAAWPATVDVVGLAHGNIPAPDARKMMAAVASHLPADTAPAGARAPAPVRVAQLPPGADWRFEVDVPHQDAALVRYFQAPDDGVTARVGMALASQMLRSDFFHELRTERQLGYVVFAQAMPLRNLGGLALVVESPTASTAEISGEVDDFLRRASVRLGAMDAESFARHKAALRQEWSKPPNNMHELSGRYWSDILSRRYTFAYLVDEIAALDAMTQAEWLAFFRAHLVSAQRRALSVYSGGALPGGMAIADAQSLLSRARHYHFPR